MNWTEKQSDMIALFQVRGITNGRVLAAMAKVRRHLHIPEEFRRADAYDDHPCPIGFNQTISQPYTVAWMTQLLRVEPHDRILEVGTGSGYQSAILAELGAEVYSIERHPELAEHARKVLLEEGYRKVHVFTGDGYKGLPEHAPFDGVIVTCAPDTVPQALVDQLKNGGRMIIPAGVSHQQLLEVCKENEKVLSRSVGGVVFVPMLHGTPAMEKQNEQNE